VYELYSFIEIKNKPVFSICNGAVSVLKEFNIVTLNTYQQLTNLNAGQQSQFKNIPRSESLVTVRAMY